MFSRIGADCAALLFSRIGADTAVAFAVDVWFYSKLRTPETRDATEAAMSNTLNIGL